MGSKIPYFYKASKKTFEFAKDLRHNQTTAEQFLWNVIRGRKLNGYKFRRQHPIGHFIADFYCHEAKLVIELDGNIHDQEQVRLRDICREEIIKEFGIVVLRFKNDDIFSEIDNVVKEIMKYLR
jgi:imidazole glycerol-phosphate synthase subunit HisF